MRATLPTTRARGLLTPAELAEFLRVDRGYVYEHAAELGAIRLGSGPKARLRFNVATVLERLNACSAGRESEASDPASQAGSRPRRRRGSGTNVVLLPIRGRQAAESVVEKEAA